MSIVKIEIFHITNRFDAEEMKKFVDLRDVVSVNFINGGNVAIVVYRTYSD